MLPISNVISGSITGRKNPNVVFAIDEKEAGAAIFPDNEEGIQAAIDLLTSTNPLIRQVGEKQFLQFGEKAIPALIELLDEKRKPEAQNSLVVNSARGLLSKMGKKAVLALTDTLRQLTIAEDKKYVWEIISTLLLIGEDARGTAGPIRQKLYEATDTDTHSILIKHALHTLQEIGGREEIETLSLYARRSGVPSEFKDYAIDCLETLACRAVNE